MHPLGIGHPDADMATIPEDNPRLTRKQAAVAGEPAGYLRAMVPDVDEGAAKL